MDGIKSMVFKDSGFKKDVVKTNAVQILKHAGIVDKIKDFPMFPVPALSSTFCASRTIVPDAVSPSRQ